MMLSKKIESVDCREIWMRRACPSMRIRFQPGATAGSQGEWTVSLPGKTSRGNTRGDALVSAYAYLRGRDIYP